MTTKAPRKPRPKWEAGDLVIVDRTRWVILGIAESGRVALTAANAMNACVWKTTINKLPRKAAA